ncbi:LAMI_0C08504g1_1 [Lachancea mirantina]|uniref:LAMI_0C08504g1_1 n=1 Tax=Lachancea mirantina TaxID=1230905 RepID=A0A1G4J5A4_9SACH|nr:LAMI_0C08504g1_1 [Lachancea mirantina]
MSEAQSKRRRVTRACDECRKKKVKCDGQQPCIHCTVYSYECTYNQPSKRSATTTATTATTSTTTSTMAPAAGSAANLASAGSTTSRARPPQKAVRTLQMQLAKYKMLFSQLFPQLPNVENLDVPTFVKVFQNFNKDNQSIRDTIKEYQMIASSTGNSPTVSVTPDSSENLEGIEGVDGSIQSHEGREITILLPPKPVALQFIQVTWEHCCVLFRFYHRPSFIQKLDDLYETDPHEYTHEHMQFLPLCYAVMAVGALFSKSIQSVDQEQASSSSNQFLQDEGYKYFIAARKLIDITNARDLNSIQAMVMLFIFLQCSARLSTCYTYIGVAMRNALREGMHRNLSAEGHGFTLIEIEMRKRLFYTIYKMDVYVNTMLGLPRSISQRDFDQALPLEIADEYITETAVYPERQGDELSSAGIANHHTKLIMILDNIVAELYPVKKTNNLISHEVVTKLELKLRQWLNKLPPELIPGIKDVPPKYERANGLLHLSFLQVQVILYRPFIHYLCAPSVQNTDSLSILRARNCISVARTVVKLAHEMIEKKTLAGSYWFSIYTIFFSVAGLIYYVHEVTPTDAASTREYEEVLQDAELGKRVLLQLKDTSMAANRTYNLLNTLFEKFNSKTIRWSHDKHGQSSNEDSKLSNNDTTENHIKVGNTPSAYTLDSVNPNVMAFDTTQDFISQPTATISGVNTINTINTSNSLSTKEFRSISESPLDVDKFFDLGDNMTSTMPQATPQMGSDTPQVKLEFDTPGESKMDQNNSESYIPGTFDQLDVQLFGRYLPPYMSQQKESPGN